MFSLLQNLFIIIIIIIIIIDMFNVA